MTIYPLDKESNIIINEGRCFIESKDDKIKDFVVESLHGGNKFEILSIVFI